MAKGNRSKRDHDDKKLTVKQLRFVEYYDGNGLAAARAAGYGGSYSALGVTAHKLLKNPKVIEALGERNEKEAPKVREKIASRMDRQQFWTDMMNNPMVADKDKLKASELLGKSEADFTENIENKGLPEPQYHFTFVQKTKEVE